jgi:hypothetical protein
MDIMAMVEGEAQSEVVGEDVKYAERKGFYFICTAQQRDVEGVHSRLLGRIDCNTLSRSRYNNKKRVL